MKISFMAVVLVVLAAVSSSYGQVGTSPTQLVHPILKDPNKRLAPTSLNRDPSLLDDQNQNQALRQRPTTLPAAGQTPQPTVVVAKIADGLAASKVSLMGTISGIKGTIYVTNLGPREITPLVQLAVCDGKGMKVGIASKTGALLLPNASERLVILATNANAVELKLLGLSGVAAK